MRADSGLFFYKIKKKSSDVTVLSTEWAVTATAIASKEIHFHFDATIFID